MEQAIAEDFVPPAHPLPDATRLGAAVLGFGVLGLVAALGSGDLATASRTLPAALVVDLGALVLTGPALFVGHQYLGLNAPIPALAAALAHAFCRAGAIALGLAPALLFFAATSGLAPSLYMLGLAGIGGFGLFDAYTGLREAELSIAVENEKPAGRLQREARMQVLFFGWVTLTSLVGLRLAFHLAGM